jgi:hypothetical protein
LFSRATPAVLCSIATLLAAAPVWAQNYTSTSAGNWNTPSIWTPNTGFPDSPTDSATTGSAVAINGDFSLDNLTFTSGGNLSFGPSFSEALRIYGAVNLDGATFGINSSSATSPNGLYFQGTSQTIANGTLSVPASSAGALLVIASSTDIAATATLQIDGTITGSGAGTLTNDGVINDTHAGDGTLAPALLVNDTALNIGAVSGSATLNVGNLNNIGTVTIAQGLLVVGGTLNNTGTIANAGGVILAGNNTVAGLGTITGAGSVTLFGTLHDGTLTGTPAIDVDGGTLQNIAFSYSPTYAAGHEVNLLDTITLNGNTLTASGGTTLAVDTSTNPTVSATLPAGSVVVDGSLLQSNSAATLVVPTGGTLTLINGSSANASGAATNLTVQGKLSIASGQNYVGNNLTLAAGSTFDVNVSAASGGQLYVEAPLDPSTGNTILPISVALGGTLHLTLGGDAVTPGEAFDIVLADGPDDGLADQSVVPVGFTDSPYSGTFSNVTPNGDGPDGTFVQDGEEYSLTEIFDDSNPQYPTYDLVVTAIGPAVATVPEPASLALLALAAPLLLRKRRAR